MNVVKDWTQISQSVMNLKVDERLSNTGAEKGQFVNYSLGMFHAILTYHARFDCLGSTPQVQFKLTVSENFGFWKDVPGSMTVTEEVGTSRTLNSVSYWKSNLNGSTQPNGMPLQSQSYRVAISARVVNLTPDQLAQTFVLTFSGNPGKPKSTDP